MNRTATCSLALMALVTSVVLSACSGGSSGTTGGGGSTTTGGGTTGGGTTGGATAGQPYTGVVILSDVALGSMRTHSAIGEFVVTVASATCQGGTPSGSCCFEPPPSSTGGAPTQVSAGSITVADSGTTIGTLTFLSGLYTLSSPASTFTWKGGDSLTVSAAGATVDSFSGTVTAPRAITGVTPALSVSSPTSITLASNWTLSWTPDTHGGETMIVALTDQAGKGEISCTAQDSAGTVTFPASLLGNFTVGHTAQIALSRSSGVMASDSNASVNILAGYDVHGSATFN